MGGDQPARRTALVLGADGRLGLSVVPALRQHGWRAVASSRADLDVTDRSAVHDLVGTLRPDAVVNLAALSDVDGCERAPVAAEAVNVLAVASLADACAMVGARLCHVSTDYVFDGAQPEPYGEEDLPHPLSVYGQTKWKGEQVAGPRALIVRTAWLCAAEAPSVVSMILDMAAAGDRPLRFLTDQVGSPSSTDDVAAVLARLISDEQRGLFHVVNAGRASWFDLARHVLAAAGEDPNRVEPITSAEFRRPGDAPRPANSVLAGNALRAAGYPALRPWDEAVAEVVARIRSGQRA